MYVREDFTLIDELAGHMCDAKIVCTYIITIFLIFLILLYFRLVD